MLLSLAVSDMGVGLLVQPLYIALCAMDFQQVSHNAHQTMVSEKEMRHLFCQQRHGFNLAESSVIFLFIVLCSNVTEILFLLK